MYVLGVVGTLSFSLITFDVEPRYFAWWQYGYLALIMIALVIVGIIVFCYGYFDTKLWLWAQGKKDQAREVIRRIYRNPGSVPQDALLASQETLRACETTKPMWLGFSES